TRCARASAASASTGRWCATTSSRPSTRSASTPSTSWWTASPCPRRGAERARKKGGARWLLQVVGEDERLYSEELWCHHCDLGFPELSPQSFSFNSPLGMCPDCNGLGTKPEMDPELVVPDPTKSVRGGAIEPWAKVMERSSSWTGSLLNKIAKEFSIDFDKPWNKLPQRHRELLLHGSRGRKIALTLQFASGKIEVAREVARAL